MSACRYKMTPMIVFLSLLVLLSAVLNSHAQDGITKNERLVARDIGFGSSNIRWCGNDRLLVYGDQGLRLLDLKGQWTVVSTKTTDYPLNCTRDGKWVIYIDRKSWRIDRGRVAPPEDEIEGEVMWQGFVEDLYRYEVSTGKVEKFATRRDRPDFADVVSPDGAKAFIGGRHNTPFKMPEPKWEMRWLKNEWVFISPHWLDDSSGMVTAIRKENTDSDIGIEIFGEKGWTKVFKWDSDARGKIHQLTVAEKNRIYFLTTIKDAWEKPLRKKRDFHRCEIKEKELTCEIIFEDVAEHNIISYFVTRGGDVVYQEELVKCVRRFSPYQTEGRCIVSGPDLTRFHGISPDGRRLAFQRHMWEEDKKYNRYDLYIMELDN